MRSLSSLVKVQRDGKVLGNYPPEELVSLLETGHLQPDDLCQTKAHPELMRLSTYLRNVERGIIASPIANEPSSWNRRHHSSRKRHIAPLLAGWIAFLLTLAGLAGAIFWINGLHKELEETKAHLQAMDEVLKKTKRDYQHLLFVSKEIAEAGTVRGTVVIRNAMGERIAMAGIQVRLYARDVIESYLEARIQAQMNLPPGTEVDPIAFLSSALPNAIAHTITDSNGRFEFKLPEEEPADGRYVITTSISTATTANRTDRIWFVAFNSHDPLNSLVNITESNSVQQLIPSLMITEGR